MLKSLAKNDGMVTCKYCGAPAGWEQMYEAEKEIAHEIEHWRNQASVLLGVLESFIPELVGNSGACGQELALDAAKERARVVVAWMKGEHLTDGTPCWCNPTRESP